MKSITEIVIVVVVSVLCVLIGKWIFESVMVSGLPDWVKYMILR